MQSDTICARSSSISRHFHAIKFVGTRFRAKIAPWVARFGRDPPSHHGVRARGLVAEIGAPKRPNAPPGTTFPAWPFLGPAASFAAGSGGAQASEMELANDERPDLPLPPRAADVQARSANASKSSSLLYLQRIITSIIALTCIIPFIFDLLQLYFKSSKNI